MHIFKWLQEKLRKKYGLIGHPWQVNFYSLNDEDRERYLNIAERGTLVKLTGVMWMLASMALSIVSLPLVAHFGLLTTPLFIVVIVTAAVGWQLTMNIGTEMEARRKLYASRGFYCTSHHHRF